MTLTTGRIEREGKIVFGDASLSVWEEGISESRARGGYEGEKQWERTFKRDVFARIVQTLNRLGWNCIIPPEKIEQYGQRFAEGRRYCVKGELKADLEISGRCIKFDMFQAVNCPTRPDHEGRYESNKEACMPYLLRLEMERTRRRIRDYLCNVFTGYTFEDKRRTIYYRPLERTAMEQVLEHYAESWHFKGDLTKYKISDSNRNSAEGGLLEHGQRVYFFDRQGRLCTGTALYNINNMWWVVTGKYDYTNVASFELYTRCPENPRIKRNARLRRTRLEAELRKSIAAMKFERAAVLRDILFPGAPALFVVWHEEHKAYHCTDFRGYTSDQSKAGKFTADEVRGWDERPNRVKQVTAAQEAA